MVLEKGGVISQAPKGWRRVNSRQRKSHFLLFFSQTHAIICHPSQNAWIFAKYAFRQRPCRFARDTALIDWVLGPQQSGKVQHP